MNGEKYNKQRRKLLQELDKGNELSIMELGMYDLTPYFNMNESEVNLSEAIMINKNYERRIEHVGKEMFFSPPQFRALQCLYEKDRVILSAPTSFGKTLLIKEYIYTMQPKHIVYIVPTNALAYELERSFKENENFAEYDIFDKSSVFENDSRRMGDEEKLFFIGTQEKYLELDKAVIGEVDLFVIDEAYKLHESIQSQRAYKLSETFLESVTNNSKKVFLLTPRARFEGFEKYNFYTFESNFNAVEKNYVVLSEERFFETLLEKGKDEKSILFCSSPDQINEGYSEVKEHLEIKGQTDFVRMLESDVHPDWSVIKLLKSGILTHHGQMPKYVQNRMINMFNERGGYNILFGTNSISEGINTVTKNLFVHPDYKNYRDTLLLKNTIGRAGRLGEYPIGYIYSTVSIDEAIEEEIEISLAISDDEELAEIEDSKDEEKILAFSEEYDISFELCQKLLYTYKTSLLKLKKILDALKKDCLYPGITNLPFIASRAFGNQYTGILDEDKILIRGYLQTCYYEGRKKIYLNDFNDRLKYYKKKCKNDDVDNTKIINSYMRFIYSTLEYSIMPVVNIGIEINAEEPNWNFGNNVLESLEKCRNEYYRKTYGNLNVDEISETHMRILGAIKDYGMTAIIKNMNTEILDEIEGCLNVRYSTFDVLKAIKFLAVNSQQHKDFFVDVKRKYML